MTYDDAAVTEALHGDRINRGDGEMRGSRPYPTTHRCCPDNLRGHESTVRCESEDGQQEHARYADAVRRGDRRTVELRRRMGPCCPERGR